ncbi:hypothetical protein ACWD6R_36545 [Streptomyces sp. NPDC005151]
MRQSDAVADEREEYLDDLRQTALSRLQQLVPAPLTYGSQAVRGVLPVTADPSALRVVLWDGRDPASTLAYDIPLVDARDDYIRHTVLIAALRDCVGRPATEFGPPGVDPVHGIPVLDARSAVTAFAQHPVLTPGDALYLPLVPLTGGFPEPRATFTLTGFFLLDDGYARYYVRWEETDEILGLDYCMRTSDGLVESRGGTVGNIFPALMSSGDLHRFRRDVEDAYCITVFDLTPLD